MPINVDIVSAGKKDKVSKAGAKYSCFEVIYKSVGTDKEKTLNVFEDDVKTNKVLADSVVALKPGDKKTFSYKKTESGQFKIDKIEDGHVAPEKASYQKSYHGGKFNPDQSIEIEVMNALNVAAAVTGPDKADQLINVTKQILDQKPSLVEYAKAARKVASEKQGHPIKATDTAKEVKEDDCPW